MSKYSKEVKQQALAMIETDGIYKTSEVMHITKLTLYRWRKEAKIGTSVEYDDIKVSDTSSVASSKESAQVPVDNEALKPSASTLDKPTNRPICEDALETAKHLLLEESNEKAARIQSLEAENAQLRSEIKQLRTKCERFCDALAALIR